MVPMTHTYILGGASVGLGVLYKVFTSWTSPVGTIALKAFHLGNFALGFGTQHWVSIIAGPVMIMAIPRHRFGDAQSKLFPCYFNLLTVSSASCLMSLLIQHPIGTMESAQMIQAGILGSNMSMSLLNLYLFGPKSTETMYQRHAIEKEAGVGHEIGLHVDRKELMKNEEYAAINKRFNRLHSASMICNLIAMTGNYAYLIHLASNGF